MLNIIQAPTKFAGLGIWSVEHSANEAYLASLLLCARPILDRQFLGTTFDPSLHGPLLLPHLAPTLAALTATTPQASFHDYFPAGTDATNIWHLDPAAVQKGIAAARKQFQYRDLPEQQPTYNVKAFLRSRSSATAGAWLNGLGWESTLEDSTFTAAIRTHIGLPVIHAAVNRPLACDYPQCKRAEVDHKGHHAFSCKGAHQARANPHKAVKTVLINGLGGSLASAGYTIDTHEPKLADYASPRNPQQNDPTETRADIALHAHGHHMLLDVKTVSPIAQGVTDADQVQGAAAKH
jgi:hypothetical protein